MNTEYDKEILSFIEDKGLSRSIITHDQADVIIDEIEARFVMGHNGIDWGKNEIIFTQKFDADYGKYLNEAGFFLGKIEKSYPYLLDERVIVIGDNLTHLSYEMKFKDFLSVFDAFLSIPQHTYIWFIKPKKCINFSFENEGFFG